MATKKTAEITESKYVDLCNKYNDAIEEAYQAMKDLSDNYNSLITGDDLGPYWNGATAKTFLTSAKSNFSKDITAYKDACEAWTKLYNRWIVLIRKGYF